MKKNILITGGSGYLGSKLAEKLIKLKKYNVFIGARNNTQNKIVSQSLGCKFTPLDITNIESLRDAFKKFKPKIVIHAAATKYVDLSENYPFECIEANVIGSMNVARVAIENNTEIVMGVSTDKAAPPIGNLYGLTKSLMERLFCSLNKNENTIFSCVRFGNIAWSVGSVFPIWKEMMDKKNIILSTGPNMRRFFFSADEAVDLVIRCINNIKITQGKILVSDMKSAQIKQILGIWKKKYKTDWKKILARKGDKNDEFLVGNDELMFTKKIKINGKIHYLISLDKKNTKKLKNSISSKNSKKLSLKEINRLIKF